MVQAATTDLWTAVVVVPVDCDQDSGAPEERKIRPIGLAEHLLKFAESAPCIAATTGAPPDVLSV